MPHDLFSIRFSSPCMTRLGLKLRTCSTSMVTLHRTDPALRLTSVRPSRTALKESRSCGTHRGGRSGPRGPAKSACVAAYDCCSTHYSPGRCFPGQQEKVKNKRPMDRSSSVLIRSSHQRIPWSRHQVSKTKYPFCVTTHGDGAVRPARLRSLEFPSITTEKARLEIQ